MNKKAQDLARMKELAKNKDKLTEDEKKEFATLVSKYKFKGNRKGKDMRNVHPGTNDLAWWNRYPVLTEAVTNLPFNYLPGTRRQIQGDSVLCDANLSAVMRLNYIPSIGKSEDDSSGFNVQMRQLWLDMHRKYRGIGTYQRSDLGIMIFCILNCFTTLAKFERIYGVINTYKLINRNVPAILKEALGIGQNLEAVLAEFRYQLNLRVSKLQQLCLPKGMSIFDAQIILNSFVFKDSENPRASLFAYDPEVFYVYDATTLSTGGMALGKLFSSFQNTTTPSGASAFTLSDILNILDMQINALLNDDDVAKMCSDLIACYGENNLQTIGYLPEDYKVEPVYDYERQLQLHNAIILGELPSTCIKPTDEGIATTTYDAIKTANGIALMIYQANDVIINRLYVGASTPGATSSANTYYTSSLVNVAARGKPHDVFFDTWKDSPDTADIMCGSRLTSTTGNVFQNSSKYFQVISAYGTELVNSCQLFYWQSNHRLGTYDYSSYVQTGDYDDMMLSLLNQFDWHPIIYIADIPDMYIFGDLDNFTTINDENLSRIHDVAVYSGFKLDLPLSNTVN